MIKRPQITEGNFRGGNGAIKVPISKKPMVAPPAPKTKAKYLIGLTT